jgi:archaellin
VQFTLASVLQDAPVDMTPPGNDHSNVVVINYSDANQQVPDLPWTMKRVGASHTGSDDMLENNEQMVITVDISDLDTAPAAYGTFTIQIVPPAGASITITRTLPGTIADVVDLH